MISDTEAKSYVLTLLMHFSDRLSEWEDTFCRDLKLKYVDPGRVPAMTEKQRTILDQLMERMAQQYGRSTTPD